MHPKRFLQLGLLLLSCACLPLAAGAADLQQPKVDNFLFVVDTSGSMGDAYGESGNTKAVTAKNLMGRLNDVIPNLDYQAGLYTVAPSRQLAPWAMYQNKRFAQDIANVPTDVRTLGFIGYPTYLAKGLNNLTPALDNADGSTALVLFSDGQATGNDPVQAAQDLYEAYPNICIHTVSLADSASGQATLDAIANLNDCAVSTSAADLDAPDALKAFAQRVFYTQLQDSDGDGVVDSKDQCPDTPEGVEVDAQGCALDSDGDGVANYKDECPETPQGVAVDAQGCAKDSDGDGVPDYKDECPDTSAGLEVDAQGCPQPLDVSMSILFETDKSNIRDEYHDELADAAAMLKKHPEADALIEGYTDSTGTEEYNMQLSKDRAQSVRDHLVDTLDVDSDRLQTKGHGEQQPTATNDTQFGRKLNRRVIITLQ
ncbi:MAG: OmpA family protein [Thermodesulfobacteriota bacterium]